MYKLLACLGLSLLIISGVHASEPTLSAGGGGMEVPSFPRTECWIDYPNLEGTGFSSEIISELDLESQIVNDFLVEWNWNLSGIRWWGVYWSYSPGDPHVTSFNLRIYEDEGCVPGNLIWEQIVPDNANETFINEYGGNPRYSYGTCVWLLLAPGHYWLEVQAGDHPHPPQWGRLTADVIQVCDSMVKSVYFSYPDWAPITLGGDPYDVSQLLNCDIANDRCDGAEEYGCYLLPGGPGGSLEGNTENAMHNYSPSNNCTGFDALGKDVVYYMDLEPGDHVEFAYTQHQANASLYILTDCSNMNSCVAGVDESDVGETETLAYIAPSADRYYLILDTREATRGGPWSLDYEVARRRWISLDTSPPGTPAEITAVPDSDEEHTKIEVRIHGFWVEKKEHEGEVYRKVRVPGLGNVRMEQLGAPDLPVLRFNLAVPTDASTVEFVSATFHVEVLLEDYLIWPQPIEALADSAGTPEVFQLDSEIYSLATLWPEVDALQSSPTETILGIPGATCETYPLQWNPTTGQLRVGSLVEYEFLHEGTIVEFEPTTKRRVNTACNLFANWWIVYDQFPRRPEWYGGEFLFIYPEAYADELLPLVNQKKTRGYRVATLTSEVTGTTCSQVRAAIEGWYNATPSSNDHYCIIVGERGDTDILPCDKTLHWGGDEYRLIHTDDLYGSTNGDDLHEEVYVGRISVVDEDDAEGQVERILAYQHPPWEATHYNKTLLVAHWHETSVEAVDALMDEVTTGEWKGWWYDLYGNNAGVNNAAVKSHINSGQGIVAYIGFGEVWAWSRWSSEGENFMPWDVEELDVGPMFPVVWSFTAENSNINVSQGPGGWMGCLGEEWMRTGPGVAAAHYGMTTHWSPYWQNCELSRQMFRTIHVHDIHRHAEMIAVAEENLDLLEGPWNSWQYLLLGDPDMEIYLKSPNEALVWHPEYFVACVGDTCMLPIQVADEGGSPVFDALVAAWKPGNGPRDDDEVLNNRYTDHDGWAQIPCEPQSPGWLYFTVQDDLGISMIDSIYVVMSPSDIEDVPGEPAFHLIARPAITRSSFHLDLGRALDEPASIRVYDVAGRTVRTLEATKGMSGIVWNGRDDAGHKVGAGIYFARLSKGDLTLTTRLVVIR